MTITLPPYLLRPGLQEGSHFRVIPLLSYGKRSFIALHT